MGEGITDRVVWFCKGVSDGLGKEGREGGAEADGNEISIGGSGAAIHSAVTCRYGECMKYEWGVCLVKLVQFTHLFAYVANAFIRY